MAAGLNFDVLAQRAAGIPVPYSYALGPTPGTPATGATGTGDIPGIAGGGSLPGTYSPAYGGIPNAPTMKDAATGALQSNLANLPSAINLTNQIDSARWASYTGRFPNYGPLSQQESDNFRYMLSGGNLDVPASVQAAKNLYGGYSGSGFGSNVMNRAVEEYALKNMTLGTNLLTQALSRGQAVPTSDPNAFSISPDQNYRSLLTRAIYGSAPIPSAAAKAAEDAALRGLLLGNRSGAGGSPTTTPTTTPTGPSIAQQVADILAKYTNQNKQDLPQDTTVENAYNPYFDYSAGMWSTPYTDLGTSEYGYEGTGEGGYFNAYSTPAYQGAEYMMSPYGVPTPYEATYNPSDYVTAPEYQTGTEYNYYMPYDYGY